ncbi:MAG: hypothetical protein JWO36_923 [Myxococcales bacterium]|nr:hypothetical protein [Myxococcales bacterium]
MKSLAARLFATFATVGLLGAPALADTHNKKLAIEPAPLNTKKPVGRSESSSLGLVPQPFDLAHAATIPTAESLELAAPAPVPAARGAMLPTAAGTIASPDLPPISLRGSFDLGARRAALPTGDAAFATGDDVLPLNARPKSLSEAQINRVMKKALGDVEYCWDRLPAAARKTSTTAIVRLSVETTGIVSDIEVESDVPASAQKCISAAAARWTFPTTEASSEVEYAIALHAM